MTWLQRLRRLVVAAVSPIPRRPYATLAIVDDALVLTKRGKLVLRVPRSSIVAVEMYKVDLLTIDDVQCQIYCGSYPEGRSWSFSEDLPGWADMLAWLETMPGFNTDWRSVVIKPAFAENRTLVLGQRPKVY